MTWPDAPITRTGVSRMLLRALACIGASIWSAAAGAQAVRGEVTQVGAGGGIAGVLIQLLAADRDSVVRSVLSDASGRFSVLAPASGEYTLQAKRIGVRRWVSDPFVVGEGETRTFSVRLEALASVLPEVVVRSTSLCVRAGDSAEQVASLWDEIVTALTATALTVEDSTHRAAIVRSSRVLDPRTRRVLAEGRLQALETTGRPFSSIEPESLVTAGYWHEVDEDAAFFFGIDERVLNSAAFRAMNCFHVTRRRPSSPVRGSLGLGFEPQKTGNGVRGIIWLDSTTFELREVEYSYTGLMKTEYSDQLGGITRFGRLTTGGWIVRDWSIRMPQYAVFWTPAGFERVYRSRVGSSVRVPSIRRIVEQGGSVHSDRLISLERPASIRGIVQDSLGKPLAGATVSLVGTSVAARSDSRGAFAFSDVAEGFYAIAADDSASADLGVHAAEHDVKIEPGATLQLTLRFRKSRELLISLCKRTDVPADRSALRLQLVDSATTQPIAGRNLRLWWTEYTSVRGFRRASSQAVDGVTGADGTMLVCGLPGGTEVNIGTALDHSRARPIGSVVLGTGSIRSIVVRSR